MAFKNFPFPPPKSDTEKPGILVSVGRIPNIFSHILLYYIITVWLKKSFSQKYSKSSTIILSKTILAISIKSKNEILLHIMRYFTDTSCDVKMS